MKKEKDFLHSGTRDSSVTERERKNREAARRAAEEGFVLLKNDGLLPLAEGAVVALLGGGASHTVKGGTGSGDVNERSVVRLDEGLRNAGLKLSSEDWLEDYEERYRQAREDWKQEILGSQNGDDATSIFNNYARHPFQLPGGRELSEKDVEGACAAVYVISRVAGEAADRKLIPGDYYLTEKEWKDLRWLDQKGIPVILIVNTGGPVELTEVQELSCVRAILLISQPGQEGGNAAADVFCGKCTPSGKLTATWARKFADYPCADTFSYLSGDCTKEYYREGIYVGYRYFDRFGVEPLYPFGFGLSYTGFDIQKTGLSADGDSIILSARVRNTGKIYSGREVVQVYVSCPQNRLPKEYRRLAGFRKTRVLKPGEAEDVEIRIDAGSMASFDEKQSAWILESGTYGLWVGNSSRSLALAGLLLVLEEQILERVEHICPLQEELQELLPPEGLAGKEEEWQREAKEKQLPVLTFLPESSGKKPEVQEDEIFSEARRISEEAEVEELIPLFYGEISKGQGALGASGVRVPGSAAETSGALRDKYGVSPVVMADGPAGLRLKRSYEVDLETGESVEEGLLASFEGGFFLTKEEEPRANTETWYQFCTAFPVGTLLAQSFDPELLREVGQAVAEEMKEFHVGWWLAPGMNIQRNPLCGRNFEYYSEDPLLSGIMALSILQGVQNNPGCGVTVKHLACNNQEDNRMGSDSILSERALREIYLRGFETAVRKGQPLCIMTSYNLVNGIHSANNRDLCTQAVRKEWGFRGLIMTDWTTTFPNGGSTAWKCIDAGNDLIMPGCRGDEESIRNAWENGDLTEQKIRECAARILNVVLRTEV